MRIKFLDDYIVDEIKCGWRHNYVGTVCGKHYMFGDNEDKGCVKFDGDDFFSKPHRIDDIIKTECKIDKIVSVELGYYNTFIICV